MAQQGRTRDHANHDEKADREEAGGGGGQRFVKRCATLFELIAQLNEAAEIERCGRIQVQRGKDGRGIRLVGLRPVATGWRSVRTLICDATGDTQSIAGDLA